MSTRLTPDPSFYATATEAATAAPEQLAYVNSDQFWASAFIVAGLVTLAT